MSERDLCLHGAAQAKLPRTDCEIFISNATLLKVGLLHAHVLPRTLLARNRTDGAISLPQGRFVQGQDFFPGEKLAQPLPRVGSHHQSLLFVTEKLDGCLPQGLIVAGFN